MKRFSLILSACIIVSSVLAIGPVNRVEAKKNNTALESVTNQRDIYAVLYLCDTYGLRQGAGENWDVLTNLHCGQTVRILDVTVDSQGEIWNQVSVSVGEQEYKGYIQREYLACVDERYLEQEERFILRNYQSNANLSDVAFTVSGNHNVNMQVGKRNASRMIDEFPASYQAPLRELQSLHPNWIFVPLRTGLNWKEVIANERENGRSLVHYSLPDCTKEGAYDEHNWYYASKRTIEYFMDPRNFLREETIFQFEQLTYNASYHTQEALDSFLSHTFMSSDTYAPETEKTYGEIFYQVGSDERFGVSPFHLAARVYQEQGTAASPMISGTYPGYEHLYNHFNIGATGVTNAQVIANGLTYARNAKDVFDSTVSRPWSDAYYSILGGGYFISSSYIRKGQDSLYLQKFNVNPASAYALYTHQYMQNISAPASEAPGIKRMYEGADSLDCAFVFTIPVFDNMPKRACKMPQTSRKIVVKLPEGVTVPEYVYIDGRRRKATMRNGYLTAIAPNNSSRVVSFGRVDAFGNSVWRLAWALDYYGGAYHASDISEFMDITSFKGFSIKKGEQDSIRYTCEISKSVRDQLTNGKKDGYSLVEYGTVIMEDKNTDKYPLIKGGEKTLTATAYKLKKDLSIKDNIYKTTKNNYRYTALLADIPEEEYDTLFAFRSYIVLEKEGKKYVLYGSTETCSVRDLQ